MPKKINRDETGNRQISKPAYLLSILKRVAVLTFALAALGVVTNQAKWMTTALAAFVAEPNQTQTTSLSRGDCNYLKTPGDFLGVQARHRVAVSTVVETFNERLGKTAELRLRDAQDVPRKNLIDDILFGKMEADGVLSAPLSTDEEFVRRIYIDLTGRIPSADAVTAFLNDKDLQKRDKLADQLIASPEFVDKWALFYGDLFKNTSASANVRRYIAGREAFYSYIKDSIANNKSYAQMATEMISANGDNFVNGATNFLVGGRVPSGPVQDTFDGQSVLTMTTFLGLGSMDCLYCHDGAGHLDAVNLWGSKATRAEAYGMAAFFARIFQNSPAIFAPYTVSEQTRGEYGLDTNYGNRQTRSPINGKFTVEPKYMFTGSGVNPGEGRRPALARHLTADPQFARAAVNYIWEELMVEALVSPSSNFDLARLDPVAELPAGWKLQPANPELLRALGAEFSKNNFNLRSIIGLIVKSSAYQLSSSYPGQWRVEYVPYYARKFVRRLRSEELHDSVIVATSMPPVNQASESGKLTTFIGYRLIDDDRKKLRDVRWAVQLPEPLEPRQNEDVRAFLNSYLRGDRDIKPRSNEPSILQALNMMNDEFVFNRTLQTAEVFHVPGFPDTPSTVRRLLADTTLSNEQIITQLYLNTLSRMPSQTEKDKLIAYFTSLGKRTATENIQWVLLNKVDFLFNY
ncbi:MAG: DUF1549 domain-containing protein [Acidobacteria bacterium]|nr:DUF1549 domain-containing protein [Acidobacteriota bacterium]